MNPPPSPGDGGGSTINNNNPDYTSLQNLLNTLQSWTEANSVTINDTKTTVLHINTSSAPVPPPQVSITTPPSK